MSEDYMNSFLKKLHEEIEKIERKYEITSVEVTEDQWNNFMKNKYFRKQAERGNANLGGYRIDKGKEFKVHTVFEKDELGQNHKCLTLEELKN
jgi:hypothetical protein